jgi:hypothetical protein
MKLPSEKATEVFDECVERKTACKTCVLGGNIYSTMLLLVALPVLILGAKV